MFDRQQLSPLHTVRQNTPHLRPDLMRREHVERLHRFHAEKQARIWQSALQGALQLAERFAVYGGNALLRWAAERKLRTHSEHM